MGSVLTDDVSAKTLYWSFAGIRRGAALAIPVIPGTLAFGAAVATVAAQKGITIEQASLMSAFVFSGTAQLLAAEAWTSPATLASILTLSALTLVANMRFILIGASLYPLFGSLPGWQVYPVLCITGDASWLITIREHGQGNRDVGLFLGAGLCLWSVWMGATLLGHSIGTFVSDARQFGLDLVMPAFFVALLVPMWKGIWLAVPWAVAGVVGLIAHWLIPGW